MLLQLLRREGFVHSFITIQVLFVFFFFFKLSKNQQTQPKALADGSVPNMLCILHHDPAHEPFRLKLWVQVEVFKTNLMTRYLSDLVTEPDFKMNLKLCKSYCGHKT